MVLVLVALIVAGCSPSVNPVAKATPTPSHTTLKWTDCGGDFQCTTVQVPMDYAHPDAGSIGIAVSRKPATDTARRIARVRASPEAKEGVDAFLGKRKASWVPRGE